MPNKSKYVPKRRTRPRTGEKAVPANWRLPESSSSKLGAYAASVKRSEAWVICDLIDTLPGSLVAVEERHRKAQPGLPLD